MKKGLTRQVCFCYSSCCPVEKAQFGGIAQLARACGSYPQCPRFESRCRYHSCGMPQASRMLYGPLVKWLRHGPFTAVTWVRIPYGSPLRGVQPCVPSYGGLAQLVRAPASHAGGHWFESSSLHQTPRKRFVFGGFTVPALYCLCAYFPIKKLGRQAHKIYGKNQDEKGE